MEPVAADEAGNDVAAPLLESNAQPATELVGSVSLLATDSDPDADEMATLRVSKAGASADNQSAVDQAVGAEITTAGIYGLLLLKGGGTYRYVLHHGDADRNALAVGQNVTETFYHTAANNGGGLGNEAIAKFTMAVQRINDTPVAADEAGNDVATPLSESNARPATELVGSVSLLAYDSDPHADETAALRVSKAGTSADNQSVVDQAVDVETTIAGIYGRPFLKADGTYRYVLPHSDADRNALAVGQNVTETFYYTAANNRGGVGNAAIAKLTIAVQGVNDAPVAADDAGNDVASPLLESNAHSATELVGSVSLLANDSDPDAGETAALRVSKAGTAADSQSAIDDAAGAETSVAGTYGTLFIKADGTYRYVLDHNDVDTDAVAAGQNVTETFYYTAANNRGGVGNEAIASLTVNIAGTSDAPVAAGEAGNGVDAPLLESNAQPTTELVGSVSLLANDSDPDAGETAALRVSKAGTAADSQSAIDDAAGAETSVAGTYGTLFIKADGTYRYVLDNADADTDALAGGQTVAETFFYTAANKGGGAGNEAIASLTVNIEGTNDAPRIDRTVIFENTFDTGTQSFWNTAHRSGEVDQLPITSPDGVNGFISSEGSWWIDPNHASPGAGYLHLVAYSYLYEQMGNGYASFDARDAEFSFNIRVDDLVLPPDAHIYFWFQSFDAAAGRFVNYVNVAHPIENSLVPGQWARVEIPLSTQDNDWLALGSNASRTDLYGASASISDALRSGIVDLGIFIFLGNDLTDVPANGRFHLDDLTLRVSPASAPAQFRAFDVADVNGSPQTLSIPFGIEDVDSTNFEGGVLRIAYSVGGGPEDRLSIGNVTTGRGAISFDGTTVFFNGTAIGTALGGADGNSLTVSFNAFANASAVEALLESVTYANSSEHPTALRTISITLDDGDGGSVDVGTFVIQIGANVAYGSDADDTINGVDGGDVIYARSGGDLVHGGHGGDELYGEDGDDQLFGDDGGDGLDGGAGADTFDGGAGFDYVYYNRATSGIRIDLANATPAGGYAQGDTFIGIEGAFGSDFGDTIIGNADDNVLYGLGGDDQFFVDNAGDAIHEWAGQGNDRVWISVSYTLTSGSEIETFTTSDDYGTAAINLTGNAFAQLIVGNDGANLINGGAGSDTLYGRAGADIFFFNSALGLSNIDHLGDFSLADDTLRLDHAVFAGLPVGTLSESALHIGAAAHDADDRIIYNSSTGALLFDADGIGGAAAQQFANVAPFIGIDNSYFIVM